MKKIFLLLIIGLTLTFTSCMSFKATDLAVLRQDSSMKMLGHFQTTVVVNEFLGSSGGANLFNCTADVMNEKINDIVWKEINKKGGNGAINIDIEYTATFLDILANSITETIWAPAHLTISGDVILYESSFIGNLDTEESINIAMSNL